MIEHRRIDEIGGTELDWLKAKHHFALGPYGNPAHKPVGNVKQAYFRVTRYDQRAEQSRDWATFLTSK